MILVGTPIRGTDVHGSGYYGAPRGNHTHKGVDYACYAGSVVYSPVAGVVTKIGYPYNPNDPDKGHLRYVQVTTAEGDACRFFYVQPALAVDDVVRQGQAIGKTQGLAQIYPGITDHFHFEVRHATRGFINPVEYLEQHA